MLPARADANRGWPVWPNSTFEKTPESKLKSSKAYAVGARQHVSAGWGSQNPSVSPCPAEDVDVSNSILRYEHVGIATRTRDPVLPAIWRDFALAISPRPIALYRCGPYYRRRGENSEIRFWTCTWQRDTVQTCLNTAHFNGR